MTTPPSTNRALIAFVVTLSLCVAACFCLVLGSALGYGAVRAFQPARGPVANVTPTGEVGTDEPRPTRTPEVAVLPTPRPAAGNTAIADETLAAIHAEDLPQRDLFVLAERYGRIPSGSPRTVTDPAYRVGDKATFTVSDDGDGHFEVTAVLQAQSDHASWWVEEGWDVDQSDLDASVRQFEERTYPTNHEAFGTEWSPGVDDDVRVHIFLGNVPGVGGYYSSADEFPKSVIETSNEKEIFYINLDNANPGTEYFDGILAHEFQHMIHWNVDRNEETWMNEGLSELAAHINGLDVDSAASSYAGQPDIPVTRWAEQTYPFYGSAFLIQLYLYERYGLETVQALVNNPLNGTDSLDAILEPKGTTFNEFFGDWMLAVLLDDSSVGDGRYVFNDESTGYMDEADSSSSFPARDDGAVSQYGIDRLDFEAGSENGTLTVAFAGDPYTTLLPVPPHSGDWALWGNRGDDSHAVVTRAFDLTGVSSATLSYWSWYELEDDFDYAYATVSTDGGTTWTPLATNSTTADNPNGNSFGAAVTGHSNGWEQQQADLTPYAGKQILIGFEVVTDDALNEPGFFVDDIEIAELNYREDFEAGMGDWNSEGFVRVGSVLAQGWMVRAVAEGADGIQVLDFPLDETGNGTLTVPGFGDDVDTVTLLVTATTQAATSKGNYRFEATVEP